jgi:hypothetical protein
MQILPQIELTLSSAASYSSTANASVRAIITISHPPCIESRPMTHAQILNFHVLCRKQSAHQLPSSPAIQLKR